MKKRKRGKKGVSGSCYDDVVGFDGPGPELSFRFATAATSISDLPAFVAPNVPPLTASF